MADIKVGDIVSWQAPSYQNSEGQWFSPMGIRGVVVTKLLKGREEGEEKWSVYATFEYKLPSMEKPETFTCPVHHLQKD